MSIDHQIERKYQSPSEIAQKRPKLLRNMSDDGSEEISVEEVEEEEEEVTDLSNR